MGLFTPEVIPEYKGSKQLKETAYGTTNLTDSESFNISKLFLLVKTIFLLLLSIILNQVVLH